MALLEILQFPDPRLRNKAKPVTQVNDSIHQHINDMLETMYNAQGVGLASTQVNIDQRIVVIDVSDNGDDPLVFINPEIIPLPGDTSDIAEGCLSVPGFYEPLGRPENVKVTALDRNGEAFSMDCDGLLSICIQHECDHLEGKLFIDTLSKLKQNRIRKKLEKQKRTASV